MGASSITEPENEEARNLDFRSENRGFITKKCDKTSDLHNSTMLQSFIVIARCHE